MHIEELKRIADALPNSCLKVNLQIVISVHQLGPAIEHKLSDVLATFGAEQLASFAPEMLKGLSQ